MPATPARSARGSDDRRSRDDGLGEGDSAELVSLYLERIEAIDRGGPGSTRSSRRTPTLWPSPGSSTRSARRRGRAGRCTASPSSSRTTSTRPTRWRRRPDRSRSPGRSRRDAHVADRCGRRAVIIAKTNLSEWANFRSSHSTSGWSGRADRRRTVRLDRNPSGSSSGSAVAVAANLARRPWTETTGRSFRRRPAAASSGSSRRSGWSAVGHHPDRPLTGHGRPMADCRRRRRAAGVISGPTRRPGHGRERRPQLHGLSGFLVPTV